MAAPLAAQAITLGPEDRIGAALLKRARHDVAFRAELRRDPQAVIERELGLLLPGRIRLELQFEHPAPVPLALPRPVTVPA